MLRRRGRPPVLAELPNSREGAARPGSLSRSQLEALGAVLAAVSGARALLVTGEEARSALALGLATVAAAEGRRTALVECDLARPSLAAKLDLAEAPGLHEYLRGAAEAPQILQPLVLAGPAAEGAVAPLTCVVAGEPAATDGPDLLASEAFGHAVAKLRGAYDLVVLGGPSLRDEPSLLAVASRADRVLACSSRSGFPKKPRTPVDGLVIAP